MSKPVVLPRNVYPNNYDVELDLDLNRFDFKGKVTVHFDILEPTKTISLHVKEIQIVNCVVFSDDLDNEAAETITYNTKLNTVCFGFSENLNKGEAKLSIEYIGEINNQMAGLYRSSYKDADGVKRIMASTQFESLDARRCFPCIDEPDRKSVFTVSVNIPSNLEALGNMPIQKTSVLPNNRKLVKFAPTVKMSTYLLALVVGEFDMIQAYSNNGVSISCFTPPGRASDGEFALATACKALDYYDEYFGIKYPLPKLDMVAIPEFACGAMENWGLVTYREVDLLLGENASSRQKQRVCIVVTHELAHQWFGNLVSMKWWDDLWLNEGFASWMENSCADHLFPEWDIWPQVVINAQASALRLDSLRSSHPIQVPINHAEEVEEVFDLISYNKGAAVVRMCHAVIGAESFQAGLRCYLKEFAYKNTVTKDLWQAWENASGKPVGKLMGGWTEQTGYPLITVESMTYDKAAGKCCVKVSQKRFLADGSELSPEENVLWTVPLVIKSQSGSESVVLFDTTESTITLDVKDCSEWICFNWGQHVPLRVLYTEEALKKLGEGVKNKTLRPENRASLLNDLYACAKAGKVSMHLVVELLKNYSEEDDYTVWANISDVLGSLATLLEYADNDKINALFLTFVAKMAKKAYDLVGHEPKPDDGHLTKLLRTTAMGLICEYDTTGEFHKLAKELYAKGDVNEDFRTSVYRLLAKHGDKTTLMLFWDEFNSADSIQKQKYVLSSIGAVSCDKLRKEVLEWSVSGKVKLQDFFYPILGMSSSGKLGQQFAWKFYCENFEQIRTMLKSAGPSLMDSFIVGACRGLCGVNDADMVQAFFEAHPLPSSARKISQSVENIRINSKIVQGFHNTPIMKTEFWEKI